MRSARRLAVACLLLLCAASLTASELQPLGAGRRIGERLDQIRELHEHRHASRSGKVATDVVSVDWEMESFIIPVAGNLQGGNGTYFRSDVTIANRRSVAQRIEVGFMLRGVNNGTTPTQTFSIPANTTVMVRDFIGTQLLTSGLGTLLIVGVDSAGNVDPGAELDGFSRIWTPQPGSSGSVSQAFESIDLQDSLATSYGYGLRQDASFRTNVGLVNLFSTSNTFTIDVIGLNGSTTFTQTVQPYSMEQVPLPAGAWGDLYIRVASAASNFNWWTAYGTSVDNVTGDGWVSHVH